MEDEPVSVELEPAVINVEAQPLRVGMRVFFSMYQLWAARHMAAQARDIEHAHDPETDRPRFNIEHRAYVMSSIVASATFMEAFINEVCQDLASGQRPPGRYDSVSDDARDVVRRYWRKRGERDDTLWKYQMLLLACGVAMLDDGSQPYQDAALVVELRNKLAHYRPETIFADDDYRLQSKLSGKFSTGVLTGVGNPWWPDHCLSFDCAIWAARSVLALADHVVDAVEIKPTYQTVDFGDPLRDPASE